MMLNRRFLIFAGVLVAASAAYGAITTDKLIIKGKPGWPGIETNAPIAIRYFPTVLTGNYTVDPKRGDYSGKVFMCRGTGMRTITLPQPSQALVGYRYTFINDAPEDLRLFCSGQKLYFDDGSTADAANYLNIATANRKRGVVVTVLCTGTYWYVESASANARVTRSQ